MRVLHVDALSQVALFHHPTAQLYLYNDADLALLDSLPLQCRRPDLLAVAGHHLCNVRDDFTLQLFDLATRQRVRTVTTKHAITAVSFSQSLGLVVGTAHGLVLVEANCELPTRSPVVAVAAAPCGGDVLAVAYQSGELVVYRQVEFDYKKGLERLHTLTCHHVENVAWHFSSVDPARQTLAALAQNQIAVWSVNVGSVVKRIRQVSSPAHAKQEATNGVHKYIRWCKGGQVVRTCADGVVLADVKNKHVSQRLIEMQMDSLDVHSVSSRCWIVDDEEFSLYDLVSGSLMESIKLPESVAIIQSPVIRLENASGKVQQITIKRSPKKSRFSPNLLGPPLKEQRLSPNRLFKPQYRESFDFSSFDDGSQTCHTPTRAFSVDSISTFDTTASTASSMLSSPPDSPMSTTSTLHSTPASVHTANGISDSLFPEVMARLLWQPKAVLPFDTRISREQYLTQSLFGVEFTDIRQALSAHEEMTGNSNINVLFGDSTVSDVAPIHQSAALHVRSQPDRAQKAYMYHGFYLEALLVSLLYDVDWATVFIEWVRHACDEKPTLLAIWSQLYSAENQIFSYANASPSPISKNLIKNYSRPVA